LKHQVIGGYLTDDLYIGSLGLSPLSVNITSLNDGFPSLLGTLSEKGIIPSESYGYLAGAYYYGYPISAYGSLTFGGYDSTRLDLAKNLTLAGGSDAYRPILLGIESITSDSETLLSESIITALDSLVSQIWLPISACKAFESAFGLVWNETYSLYILDDPQRNALLAKNPNITFTLSTGISDSPDRLNITLPYAAFDLNASYPLAGNDTVHYFPLKQAANDTQYTLGRTFLQEVYMIADYAHGDITLYPAVYPEEFVQSNLVTICPLNSTACVDPRYGTPATQQPTKSTNFPTSAVVGSIIGVLALLGLGIFLALRRRTKKRTRMAELEGSSVALTATAGDKPELADTQKPVNFNELEGPNVQNPEIWKPFSELESGMGSPRQELDGGFDGTFERYEMPAEEISAGNNSIYKGR
jgi:MYXO-CTERM domain-containing protein